MPDATNKVTISEEKMFLGAFYAGEFAERLRALLNAPLGDYAHADALARCKAILEMWDER